MGKVEWGPQVYHNNPVKDAIERHREFLTTELRTVETKVKEADLVVKKFTPVIEDLKRQIEELDKVN